MIRPMNHFVFYLFVFFSILKLSINPVSSSVISDEVDFDEKSSGDASWSAYSSSNELLDSDESLSDPKEKEAVGEFKASKGDENDSLNSHESPFNYQQSRYHLRTQIKDDLDLLTNVSPSVRDQLMNPILCLGTGRQVSRLFYSHLCPTLIQKEDYCVDLRTTLNPDESFNVFDNNSLENFCKKGMRFNFIYFSHVGSYFPHDTVCCYQYSRLVKPGGAFLFKSYAFLPEVDLVSLMSFKSMKDAQGYYSKMFKLWGFRNIQVIEKSEAVDLADGEAFGKSLIIYAEKIKDQAQVSLKMRKLDMNAKPHDVSASLQSPDISEEDDLEKTLPMENDDIEEDENAPSKATTDEGV